MNIVVLDGFGLNPGDLSWSGFEKLGNLTVYDRTPVDKRFERAKDAEILITNKTPVDRELIASLDKLKYIGALSTGFNIIDIDAARERNIPVTNIPSYCTKGVAQMFFSLLFEITNAVGLHSESVRNGEWESNLDFCYWKTPLIELEGKKMGIIGYGNIGKSVADIALALGMEVLVNSRTKKEDGRVEWVTLENLLSESDVIGLCCPLNSDTEKMINAETITLMKSSAILINTSRGAVIDDNALADALNRGKIYAAGLDVLTLEPPKNNPLTSAKNCFITPHIAWASFEARTRLMNMATENLAAFLNGKPQNVVNK